jgi:hypothetical protein
MDIRCDLLVKAIGNVVPAMADREVFDQANKVAFKDGCLISYDDHMSISQPLVGSEEITGAIDGRRLHSLLSSLSGDVNVRLALEGEQLMVGAGRTKAKFSLVPVNLPLEEIDQSGDYMDLPVDFTAGLALVHGCCARELSRPVLTCVSLKGNTMTASDGFRVAEATFADG